MRFKAHIASKKLELRFWNSRDIMSLDSRNRLRPRF